MEDELNYAMVTFETNSNSERVKLKDLEIIYDNVNTREQASDTTPAIPEKPDDPEEIYDNVKTAGQAYTTPVTLENKKKAPLYTLLLLVAAVLGIICVVLVSVIVSLNSHFNAAMSERLRENTNLTAQNLQLLAEKSDLERRTEELTREKDGFNWTIGVILEYKDFPVNAYCPQKVCKPCLDGWVLFRSHCYQFNDHEHYWQWKNWEKSREECRKNNSDLVVVESEEEQKFISNHTKEYDDEKHGYWIGLNNYVETWTWVDGSNITVMYWMTQKPGYKVSCALTLPRAEALASWDKVSCDMKNRWICEKRALIKPESGIS